MKRLFNIPSNSAVHSHSGVVLCELSHYHMSIALADAQDKKLQQVSYYEPAGPITVEQVNEVLNNEAFDWTMVNKLVVSSAFPELALVPQALFVKEQPGSFLATSHTLPGDPVFFDTVKEADIVLVYSIPRNILNALQAKARVDVINVFTPLLQSDSARHTEDAMLVDFTPKEFRVLVKKNNQLQVVQTYAYMAPPDVVYYLLAICQQYGLSQSDTRLVLSGLMDKDSALYNELHQYFSNLHFANNDGVGTGDAYPQHFFSSLYNLAACVL